MPRRTSPWRNAGHPRPLNGRQQFRDQRRPIGNPVHYDADWHGGDLQGALAVMKTGYFEKLGVRTIWLSPLNAQTDKYHYGDGNQLYSAYHGYWPIASRALDPRFATEAELDAFVDAAHARGIRVLFDVVPNHVHQQQPHTPLCRSARSAKASHVAGPSGWTVRVSLVSSLSVTVAS